MSALTSALASMSAVVAAVGLIVVWAALGPVFGFSDTWQQFINTATTLVTFVMVFVIQNSQNRDSRALQTKLDDILSVIREADDKLIGIEDLPEKQIKDLQGAMQVRAEQRRDEVESDAVS